MTELFVYMYVILIFLGRSHIGIHIGHHVIGGYKRLKGCINHWLWGEGVKWIIGPQGCWNPPWGVLNKLTKIIHFNNYLPASPWSRRDSGASRKYYSTNWAGLEPGMFTGGLNGGIGERTGGGGDGCVPPGWGATPGAGPGWPWGATLNISRE